MNATSLTERTSSSGTGAIGLRVLSRSRLDETLGEDGALVPFFPPATGPAE